MNLEDMLEDVGVNFLLAESNGMEIGGESGEPGLEGKEDGAEVG